MIDSWSDYYNRQTTSAKELLETLYAHFQACAEVETPSELIERFRRLFIEGLEYPNHQVLWALEVIVNSDFAEREFKYILNRCCYILINRWQNQPRLQGAIPELIKLFESSPTTMPRSRTSKHLRQLVHNFADTEQYRALRHLSQVLVQQQQQENSVLIQPLSNYLNRYPYLYEHCLLTNDCTGEQRQIVRAMRLDKQKQFELDLSQYITYQQLQKPGRTIANPTLLTDDQFDLGIKEFRGKIDGNNTYRDLAAQFQTYSQWSPSYRTFKKEFYQYLTDSVDLTYGNCRFNERLSKQLNQTLTQYDNQKVSEILVLGTCRKLLNFLVVESQNQPQHYIFTDLLANVGIRQTIGLLLKIVLFCRKVRYDLEKRFAILFNHYEDYTNDKVKWLVEALENLNLALTTNFGPLSNFSV